MRLYTTGLLAFIGAVASFVANMELSQKFNESNPQLFWGVQIFSSIVFVVVLLYIIVHWDKNSKFTKLDLLRTVLISGWIYFVAYLPSKISIFVIFINGVTEIYIIRKKAGLIKSKKDRD